MDRVQTGIRTVGPRVWWRDVSEADALAALEKASQYGSADLRIMGEAMAALVPDIDKLDNDSRRSFGLEMAIAFYLLGKVSRLFGAYQSGSSPSDDTWHDITVYSMMARHIRVKGEWP